MKLTYPIPENTGWISRRFGENPGSYARFGLKGHNGIDFAVVTGTPVMATDGGVVSVVSLDPPGYGLYIRVTHAWGISLYAHLSEALVKAGEQVSAGDVIAKSGNTGNSTGPHLHFEIRPSTEHKTNGYNGAVDPMPYLSGDAELPPPAPQISLQDAARIELLPGMVIRLRHQPSLTGRIFGNAVGGMQFDKIGDLVEADGHLWAQVKVYMAVQPIGSQAWAKGVE